MRATVQKYLTDQGDLEALHKRDNNPFENVMWKVGRPSTRTIIAMRTRRIQRESLTVERLWFNGHGNNYGFLLCAAVCWYEYLFPQPLVCSPFQAVFSKEFKDSLVPLDRLTKSHAMKSIQRIMLGMRG